jgi:hypothetical protein
MSRGERGEGRAKAAIDVSRNGSPGFAKVPQSLAAANNSAISARVSKSTATVQRSLRRLEAFGLVERRPSTDNPTGRLLVLLFHQRSTPASSVMPGGRSPVSEELKNERERERPIGPGMVQAPSRPAGEEKTEETSPEDLARLREWAAGSDPVLAKFGRAALKLAGVVDPVVVDAPHEPAIDQLALMPLPAVEPRVIMPELTPVVIPSRRLSPGQTTSAPGEVAVGGESIAVVTDGVVVEPVGAAVPRAVVVVEAVMEPAVPPAEIMVLPV